MRDFRSAIPHGISAIGLLLASTIAPAAPVAVSVDLTRDVHPFNQQIFGVAFWDTTNAAQMGYTVNRWGGNAVTRYNWQIDSSNHASDYLFLNEPQGSGVGLPNNSTADQFIVATVAKGAAPLITIPTIGYVAKSRNKDAGFSIAKYGPQTANECTVNNYPGCNADAGNGRCTAVTAHCNGQYIIGNAATDTSIAAPGSFEGDWIDHMHTVAGGATNLFSLDNESMLWNSTHRDAHPAPPTFDEIWGKAMTYASVIKARQPSAIVTGPVTWGYCDLFGSAADNCVNGADRLAHKATTDPNDDGPPFVYWYLEQVCRYQQQHGVRLVDYVDLHYYPQDPNGAPHIYSNSDDSATRARRLASMRELYDSTWVSQAWIKDIDNGHGYHYDIPNLIPRVRAWIDLACPGTKLAITEYNWGDDNLDSATLAQAEVLAIFAREGVDLATRWVAPDVGSKAERAFNIFLNYDGAGGKVAGDSVHAASANVDQVGAYAFHSSATHNTFVLLTNKTATNQDVTVTFNSIHTATWKLYGFGGSQNLHQIGSDGQIASDSLTISALPTLSANLLVVPDGEEIFKNGFDPVP